METAPNSRQPRRGPAWDALGDAVRELGIADIDTFLSKAGAGDDDEVHPSVARKGTSDRTNRQGEEYLAPASGEENPDTNPRKRSRETDTTMDEASPPASEDTVLMIPPHGMNGHPSPGTVVGWRVRAPCRDAPSLTYTVLRSVKLWLEGHDPSEVARMRRFDQTVTPVAVELHVLIGLQNAYGATADRRNVQRMADGFECWPSERDWKSIANGSIATGVDIYREVGGREGLGALVDWLGGPKSERWMWHCKIEAVVALTRLGHPFEEIFSLVRDSKKTKTDELQLTKLPQDVIGDILPYCKLEEVRSLSVISHSMKTARRMAEVWRKSMFFTRIQRKSIFFTKIVGNIQACGGRRGQNVNVACSEDFPDARCAPEPSHADFSTDSATDIFVQEPGDSSVFETLDRADDVDSVPGTIIQNGRILSCSKNLSDRNEEGTASPSSFEMLLFATDRHGDLLVANGTDSYGSFIAAGYNLCNLNFVIARRYLKQNDPRKKWSLQKLRNEVLADAPARGGPQNISVAWQTKALHVDFPAQGDNDS